MTITLTVPMPPTASNRAHGRSRHWRVIEREKREYWQRLDNLLLVGDLPAPPAQRIAHATLRSSMVLRGAMDDDNAVIRHKWPIDWLVTRGYLVSDRRTCLRWAALPDQRVTRKEDPTITLTLTNADHD